MQKRNLLIIILFLFTGTIGWSAERIRQNFDFDWQFRLGEQGIYKPVQLPHDWSDEYERTGVLNWTLTKRWVLKVDICRGV